MLALTVACAPAQSAAPGEHPDDRGHGHGHAHRHARLSVATYNIYLGADLNPLFRASTPEELTQAAASAYAQMERALAASGLPRALSADAGASTTEGNDEPE